MEFEKDVPPTEAEIALADVPKLVVVPTDSNVQPEPVNSNYTHLNEAPFEFETETTDTLTINDKQSNNPNHHSTAIIVAATCTLLFIAALVATLLLR